MKLEIINYKLKTITVFCLLLASYCFISSCHKVAVPSYIYIDKTTLTTINSTQGSSTQKIVDSWIYIDDNLVGAFELPCTVPALYAGSHTVKILPGIKENGISDTRIQYPYYNTYSVTVNLTQGAVTTINPTTTYTSFAHFAWIQDFSGGSTQFCDSTGSDTILNVISDAALTLPGNGSCAGVVLSGSKNTFNQTSCGSYVLPQDQTPVFLELDYNCNTQFNVGILAWDISGYQDGSITALTIRPSSGWNKIYVSLNPSIAYFPTSKNYQVYFSMVKDANLSSSWFYIDNVKLVY